MLHTFMNTHCQSICLRGLFTITTALMLTQCGESKADKAVRQAQEMVKEAERRSELAAKEAQAEEAKRHAEEAARKTAEDAEIAARKLAEEQKEAAAKAAKLAEEQSRQMAKEQKLKEEEEARTAAKAEFAKEAEEQFGKVNLEPKIEFAAALKAGAPSVELRGPLLAKLRELVAAKDWMGLLKEMGSSSMNSRTGLPQAGMLGQAVERTLSKPIPLVVKVPVLGGDSARGSGYHLVSLRTLSSVAISELHPDGGAYVVQWQPKMGDCLIVKGSLPTVSTQLWGGNVWTSSLKEERERLEKKKALGEVDAAGVAQALAAKQASLVTELRRWAGISTEGGAHPLQEAANALTQRKWPHLAELLRAAASQSGADPRIAQAATLAESIVANLKEIEAIPARIKAGDDEYARLNLEAAKPQPEAQRDATSKKALQVRDSVAGLPMHSTELKIKAEESARTVSDLLHAMVAF